MSQAPRGPHVEVGQGLTIGKQGGHGQSVPAFTLAGTALGACTPEPTAPLLQICSQIEHRGLRDVQEK